MEKRKRLTNKSIAVGKRVVRLEAQSVKALESRIDENFSRAVDLIYHIKGRVIITGLGNQE